MFDASGHRIKGRDLFFYKPWIPLGSGKATLSPKHDRNVVTKFNPNIGDFLSRIAILLLCPMPLGIG